MIMHKVSKLAFIVNFATAREDSEKVKAATSTVKEIDDATNDHDRFMLTADGQSGFIVRNGGELIALFSTVKGRGNDLVQIAVQCGAEYLDCFDGYLPELYARHGFSCYKREANWTPGGPDVVFMHIPSELTPDILA